MANQTNLQSLNTREDLDTRAKDNGHVDTRYTGTSKNLLDSNKKGLKGQAYFNIQDDCWYFRPVGAPKDDWYRVNPENLDLWEK